MEALLVVDLLRRGGVEVTMASITEDEFVRSSHGVNVEMDAVLGEVDVLDYDAIILPGGMPGTINLGESDAVRKAILAMNVCQVGSKHCTVIGSAELCGKRYRIALSGYQIQSGCEEVNRMVNIWNQYQCMVTFNMSRSASYYESGIGRGMGFRDSCQDLLGFAVLPPRPPDKRHVTFHRRNAHSPEAF